METTTTAVAVKDANAHKIKTTAEFSEDTNRIIIPKGMTKKQAAEDLMLQYNNEEQVQDFLCILEGWDWKDSLRAVRNTMETEFGWIKGVTTESFWGKQAPIEIDIVTNIINGKTISEKAFYGKMAFPAWDNAQGEVGISIRGAYIKVNAKRKFSVTITEFFNNVRNYLATNSIYRGKSVVVGRSNQMGQEVLDLQIIEIIPNEKIFLNQKEEVTVNNFVLGDLNAKGKRCYLFTGSYGNGKTETAMRIGAKAVAKNISFFYVKKADLLVDTLQFARNYEPCVVFLEDVDETASGEQRDEQMNGILNTLDGVQTKGRDIMVLFTTNHEKRINPALRRPGRIDLIVNFSNPEKDTIEKIYRSYFTKYNGNEELDYHLLLEQCPDAQGAVIAEIAKRACKLAERDNYTISTELVLAAQASMEYQIQFMQDPIDKANEVQTAFDTIRDYMQFEKSF